MSRFFNPLFRIQTQEHVYNHSFEEVRFKIESIFANSDNSLSATDINARFTGGDTFKIESRSPGYTRGVRFQSTLLGSIQKEGQTKTKIVTNTQAAISLRILFWLSLILSSIYIISYLFYEPVVSIWYGIALGIIGPFLAIKFADINNFSIEYRYRLFIHKKLNTI